MSTPQNVRASDQDVFSIEGRKDFIPRKHGLSRRQIQSLALAALLVVGGVMYLVYNNMMLGSILCFLTGLVLFIFARQLERRKKDLMSTEFLNALFAAALAADHQFCIIVKQGDGRIVYLNNGFQKMFPEMIAITKRTLDNLFSAYAVSEAEQKSVMHALRQPTASLVPVQIQSGRDKKSHAMVMSVEPITRPSGFCLVRGREQ